MVIPFLPSSESWLLSMETDSDAAHDSAIAFCDPYLYHSAEIL